MRGLERVSWIMDQKNESLYEEETYKIIDACMKVHSNLDVGFLESVYQESVEKELTKQAVEFDRQVRLQLT